MIKKSYISKQNMHLSLGVILSVFVLLQSVRISSVETDNKEQTDKKSSEKEAQASFSKAQAITNSSSQISLDFDSYLLNEVTFKKERNDKKSSTELLIQRIHKAIQILLRKIISPNAP